MQTGGEKMKYHLFSHLTKIENRIFKTYGIVAIENLFCKKVIKDISMDRKAIKHLVKDLNDYQVELVHLDDIVEDFIC